MIEPTLYVKKSDDLVMFIVAVYVDDRLLTGPDAAYLENFKTQIMTEFEMIDLELMRYFLGMEIIQTDELIMIHQAKYARDLLRKFKMESCKPVYTTLAIGDKLIKNDGADEANGLIYRSIIGSILYLAATRPDIMFSTSLLSRFMQSPSEIHFKAAKRVLRYIKGTVNYGIKYSRTDSSELQGYIDSDWAGSLDDSKSTRGFCFSFSSGMFSWNSKKQEVVAQSSVEAEYIAISTVVNHIQWLRKILVDLGISSD
ncbi:PREDICTED: uncharacterized mitochondrial protein AtMg00810-like [Theobroma cacao]|uniref:Uncharacterized mitochondrial protein AtMg00810-like n=1 Tax=Theobroma cacao TaxID=3641 RepID=A0AB32WXU5_THECC|nr:PREDICTED: uncharacterized mitochondrial protein AtMg00810-like [Theobroma cacao]